MNEDRMRVLYQQGVARRPGESRTACPEPEAMLTLLEGRGSERERLAVLDHVMACGACHRELGLIEAVRAAAPADHGPGLPRRLSSSGGPWLAIAAVLAILVSGALVVREFAIERDGTPLTRGESATIALVSPHGTISAVEDVELTWRTVPRAASYEVEILTVSGDLIFASATADTVLGVPPSLLRPGEQYRWWVQARTQDGAQLRSPFGVFHRRAP